MVKSRRKPLRSTKLEELKRRKRKILKIKILLSFLLLILIFVGLVFLSRVTDLNIKNIEISGNRIIDTSDIEKVVEENLSEYYLYFIPKSNVFLYPKENISDSLHSSFKRMESVSMDVSKDGILKISVSERSTKYIYCGELLPVESFSNKDNKCYFMDEEGFIFDKAPYFSGDVYFRFFGNVEEVPGSHFYPDFFNKFVHLKEGLDDLDFEPIALSLNEEEDIEIYLKNKENSVGPRVIVSLYDDEVKIIENLSSALDTGFRQKINEEYAFLEYIDLRFNNKVYYRFDE